MLLYHPVCFQHQACVCVWSAAGREKWWGLSWIISAALVQKSKTGLMPVRYVYNTDIEEWKKWQQKSHKYTVFSLTSQRSFYLIFPNNALLKKIPTVFSFNKHCLINEGSQSCYVKTLNVRSQQANDFLFAFTWHNMKLSFPGPGG